MTLLVDIGNTRLKWTSLQQPLGVVQAACHSEGESLGDVLSKIWGAVAVPDSLFVACVAKDQIEEELRSWVAEQWSVPVQFAESRRVACGVRNGYREPDHLGVDRWAALIGVYRSGYAPACVVDAGTALTIDGLCADGEHIGGAIFPGERMLTASFATATARVRGGDDTMLTPTQSTLFACDTRDGIVAGALYGAAALVERAVEEMRGRFGEVACVVTGGNAPRLLPLLRVKCLHVPDLVLRGMACLREEVSA